MNLKFKNDLEKLVDYSVESQFKRENRLRGHVSSFFAASSIVLVAETTLFSVLSFTYYEVCTFLWYVSIVLLVLQILLIVICYVLLFPGDRINIESPSKLYKWYEDNFKKLELEQKDKENIDEKECAEMNMLKAETKAFGDIYDSVKRDVDSGYVKLRVMQIISIMLVATFSHITLVMCLLKLFKK